MAPTSAQRRGRLTEIKRVSDVVWDEAVRMALHYPKDAWQHMSPARHEWYLRYTTLSEGQVRAAEWYLAREKASDLPFSDEEES